MHHDTKFDWTLNHQAAFISLKGTCIQESILHYPDPSKWYIKYTDASDDACGAQLSCKHNSQELPGTFLSHTFTDAQWKWSTPKQEAYGAYYAKMKWNYYLQGSGINVSSDHKPLPMFLHGKNKNNKVNW